MSGGKHGRKPTQGDQRKKPVVQGYSVHSYFRVDIDIIYWWPADGTLSVLTLHHTQYNTCWISHPKIRHIVPNACRPGRIPWHIRVCADSERNVSTYEYRASKSYRFSFPVIEVFVYRFDFWLIAMVSDSTIFRHPSLHSTTSCLVFTQHSLLKIRKL